MSSENIDAIKGEDEVEQENTIKLAIEMKQLRESSTYKNQAPLLFLQFLRRFPTGQDYGTQLFWSG